MNQYHRLAHPVAKSLLASSPKDVREKIQWSLCPANDEHRGFRRVSPLAIQVKHNKRDELMIWAWLEGPVIHSTLAAEFKKRGLTGYRLRPASVNFRDGVLSKENFEIKV